WRSGAELALGEGQDFGEARIARIEGGGAAERLDRLREPPLADEGEAEGVLERRGFWSKRSGRMERTERRMRNGRSERRAGETGEQDPHHLVLPPFEA